MKRCRKCGQRPGDPGYGFRKTHRNSRACATRRLDREMLAKGFTAIGDNGNYSVPHEMVNAVSATVGTCSVKVSASTDAAIRVYATRAYMPTWTMGLLGALTATRCQDHLHRVLELGQDEDMRQVMTSAVRLGGRKALADFLEAE